MTGGSQWVLLVPTHRDARALIEHLKSLKFGLTSVSARGTAGHVRLIFTVIRRRQLRSLEELIHQFNPNAFVAIQSVRTLSREPYPVPLRTHQQVDFLRWFRKGK